MPPWNGKGAGGASGHKGSAGKRTVRGKQRAAHRRPPARLLARRRSPKRTVQRRAEIAGRNRRLLRAGLAFVAVATLSAVSVSYFLDGIANDSPIASQVPPAALAENPAEPATEIVAAAQSQQQAAAVTLPRISPTEPDEAPEASPATEPALAESVAPAAPPPDEPEEVVESAAVELAALANDESETASENGTVADSVTPAADMAPPAEATSEESVVDSSDDIDAAPESVAPETLTPGNAEATIAEEASPITEDASAAVESETAVAAEESSLEVAAAAEEAPGAALSDVIQAAFEVEERPDRSVETTGEASQAPAEQAADLVEADVKADTVESTEAELTLEEKPASESGTLDAPTHEAAESDDGDVTSVALAADLMPHALPEEANGSATEPPIESEPVSGEAEAGPEQSRPLPEVAKQALAEVDSLAEEVEKVLVEPVTLSELLPSAAPSADVPIESDALVERNAAPADAEPSFAEFEPALGMPEPDLVPAESTETERESEAKPIVELVEEPSEPQSDSSPSILAEPLLDDSIPGELLTSAGETLSPPSERPQVASLTPEPQEVIADQGEWSAMPLPVRRPGPSQIALRSATDTEPVVGDSARWQRNAVSTKRDLGEGPMIALVIDDLGLNRPKTWQTIELPAPLTLAFLTYATGLPEMTAMARARGHELIVHVPMEPIDPGKNPGTNALATRETMERVIKRLDWGLSRFEGYVGINNHMGSRFTAWTAGMEVVMREMRRRGLLFLDSLTTYQSVGGTLAERHDVPYALRDIFLDNEAGDATAIRRQLEKLESVALEKGYAVGIGHPYTETLRVLSEWMPRVKQRGIRLVPISAVVRHRIELAAKAE